VGRGRSFTRGGRGGIVALLLITVVAVPAAGEGLDSFWTYGHQRLRRRRREIDWIRRRAGEQRVGDRLLQTVDMLFRAVGIPPGATIIDAYVQFKTDEKDTAATALTIQGVASDNAAASTSATSRSSSRRRTAPSVS